MPVPELIQECLRGSRSAQNELYRTFAPAMFTLCLRYGGNREAASELLQEGFIKVFAALHQYKSEGSFEGWMRRIMLNTALDHFRRRPSFHAFVPIDSSPAEEVGEETVIESTMTAKELMALVQALPKTYRVIFNLYVFEGYHHKEIAALLNISEGTSKSNLYDARKLLKEKIRAAQVIPRRASAV